MHKACQTKKKRLYQHGISRKKTKRLAVCVSEDDAALTGLFLLILIFGSFGLVLFHFSNLIIVIVIIIIIMDGNCYYSYLFCKLKQCFAISIIRFYIVKEANHAQKKS